MFTRFSLCLSAELVDRRESNTGVGARVGLLPAQERGSLASQLRERSQNVSRRSTAAFLRRQESIAEDGARVGLLPAQERDTSPALQNRQEHA